MTDYLNESFDLSNENTVSVLDEFPLWSSYFGARLLDEVNYKKGITALDIGCGTGFPLIELAQRLGSSSKVYGIDPWTEAGDRIDLKLRTMNISNVTFHNQTAEVLPFDDNYFDLIVSNNGINNVQEPEKVLAECRRVLKPSGQFIMTVNLPGTMIEFYNILSSVLLSKDLSDSAENIAVHISSKRKSVEENKNLLAGAGFKVTKTIEDIFYMRYADGSAFLNHYFIKLAFLDSWKNIPPQDKLSEVFEEVEKRSNMQAEKDGQLNLSIPFVLFNCI
jgi:arsenite methyltransferase